MTTSHNTNKKCCILIFKHHVDKFCHPLSKLLGSEFSSVECSFRSIKHPKFVLGLSAQKRSDSRIYLRCVKTHGDVPQCAGLESSV